MYLQNHSYYSLRYGTMPPETLAAAAKAAGIEVLPLTDINNTTGMMDFIRLCREQGITPVAGADIRNGNDHLYTLLARNNEGFREINECITWHNLSSTPYDSMAPPFSDVYVVYPLGNKPSRALHDNEYIGIRPAEVSRLVNARRRAGNEKYVVRQPVSYAGRDDYDLHLNLRAVDNNVLLTHLMPRQAGTPHDWLIPREKLMEHYSLFPFIPGNTERLLRDCSVDIDFESVKNKRTFTGSAYDDRVLLEKLALDGMEYRYGSDDSVAQRRVRHELGIIDRLGFSSYFLITWDIIRYSMSRGFYHVGRGSGANSVVAYCLRITDVDPIELDLYFERFINPRRTSPPDFDIDYSWKERDQVLDYIFKRYGHKHTALLGAMGTFRGNSIVRELGKVHGLPKNEIDDLLKEPGKVTNFNGVALKIKELFPRLQDFPNIRSIHAGGVLISEEPITCYAALDLPPKGFPTTQWDMYVAEDIGFEKLDILSQRGIGHIKECAELVRRNRGINLDVHRVGEFKRDMQVQDQLRRAETNGCFYIESPAMRGLLTKLRCDNYLTLVAASSIIRPGVARSGMMREYIHRFHHPDRFSYIHPVMEEQLRETFGVMVYQEDVLKVCHHFAGLDLADADILRRAMSGKHRSRSEFDRIRQKFFENCKSYGYPEATTTEVWRQIESFAGYSFSKAHSASYAVESFQSLWLKAHYPLEFMTAVINNFGGFYQSWVYFNEARRQGAQISLPCVNNSEYTTVIRGSEIFIGFIHLANLEREVAKRIVAERRRNGPYTGLGDFLERTAAPLEQLIILIRSGALRFTGKSKAQLLWEGHLLGKAESGKRRAERGEGRGESGERKAESGERKAESGKRKAESGKRRAESGERGTEDEGQHPPSDIRQPTSDIQHPPSDIRQPTSDIQHPPSDIRHPISDIQHPTSDIRHPTSDIQHPTSDIRHPTSGALLSLFRFSPKEFTLPELAYDPLEDAYDEIELLGFPVSMSWFDMLMTSFRGEIMAGEMAQNVGKTVRMLGALVTIKYVRTVRHEWMHFAAFLDKDGEFFDSVHFPPAVRDYPFRGQGVYLILGKVVEEFGFPSIDVIKMAKLPFRRDPRRE